MLHLHVPTVAQNGQTKKLVRDTAFRVVMGFDSHLRHSHTLEREGYSATLGTHTHLKREGYSAGCNSAAPPLDATKHNIPLSQSKSFQRGSVAHGKSVDGDSGSNQICSLFLIPFCLSPIHFLSLFTILSE